MKIHPGLLDYASFKIQSTLKKLRGIPLNIPATVRTSIGEPSLHKSSPKLKERPIVTPMGYPHPTRILIRNPAFLTLSE